MYMFRIYILIKITSFSAPVKINWPCFQGKESIMPFIRYTHKELLKVSPREKVINTKECWHLAAYEIQYRRDCPFL
jgi:hypothetical protein